VFPTVHVSETKQDLIPQKTLLAEILAITVMAVNWQGGENRRKKKQKQPNISMP
jgi:hypothetical protein